MPICLRPATLNDLDAIIALDQLIFGAYGAEESPAVIRARLVVFPAGCVVLVGDNIEEGEQARVSAVKGYLTTEKWSARRTPMLDEDPNETHDSDGKVLNITTLAVAPGAQGKGYGRLLLEEAIKIGLSEGCHEIVLETARARDFYSKHGFHLIEERSARGIPMAIMGLTIIGDK